MKKKISPPNSTPAPAGNTLVNDIRRHISFTLGNDPDKPSKYACYMGLAYSVRDRLIEHWIKTQRALHDTLAKRVYFLSLEFLPGRFLKNYLISLQMEDEARRTLEEMGFDLDELEEEEWDAGLGNGGLGRLASCYMDSMACRDLPGYGYGIRYDYGIFHQILDNGYQREQSDNWRRRGNPWEIQRRNYLVPVRYWGRSEKYAPVANGPSCCLWIRAVFAGSAPGTARPARSRTWPGRPRRPWPWTFTPPCAVSNFPSTFAPITIRRWIVMPF